MTTPLCVLIVEDSADEAELIVFALETAGYQVTSQRVECLEAMQQALECETWDVVLCDYSMPQFDALRALGLLQAKQLDLPFIMVSGTVGEETAVAAMKAGVHDYVMKDKLARLAPAIEREMKEALIRDERRQALEQLRYRAYYDPLTGLPNQARLLEWIGESLSRQSTPFAVLHLDVDHYRAVKYGLGHARAEDLLMALSGRLSQILRDKGSLARVATDGFAVLVWNAIDRAEVEQMLDNIHATISLPFNLSGSIVTTSVSIGIIYSSIGYTQPEDFLRAADTAMNESRLRSPGGTIVFDVEMQVRNQARLQLEIDLRQAINQQQLFLNYQPIVCLRSGLPLGFEALVRWQHPDRGAVSPLDFIPLAEETRLIVSLGEWVLREACQQLGRLQIQFPAAADSLSMNVNLSGVQLEVLELQTQIDQALADAGVKGHCLKVEVTESVLMSNPAQAIAILNHLKARQISICIDDFGTGYSSLSYLRHLPINTLKIDQTFVNGLDDPKNLDIVRAIVTLAQALELDVVAEGIETDRQLEILQSLGCSAGQGYLFARPLAESQIADWLQKFTLCPDNRCPE